MSLFTRITATIGATADKAVSQFENHEAIADSALAQARQAVVKARMRHSTLQRTGADIKGRIEKLDAHIEQWTDRARRHAATDESKALECLALRQECQQTLESLTKGYEKHEVLEATMLQRVNDMEQRLQAMMRQRDEMRSRESVAKANAVMDRIGPQGNDAVDAVFERWEMSISDSEILHDAHSVPIDNKSILEQQFETEERQEALKAELADLMTNSGDSDAK